MKELIWLFQQSASSSPFAVTNRCSCGSQGLRAFVAVVRSVLGQQTGHWFYERDAGMLLLRLLAVNGQHWKLLLHLLSVLSSRDICLFKLFLSMALQRAHQQSLLSCFLDILCGMFGLIYQNTLLQMRLEKCDG